MKRFFTKSLLLAALSAFLLTSCYGNFSLTRKLYAFNGSIGNKYVRSAVTWVLIWCHLPIGFVDFCLLNVIEFWTGSNPLGMDDNQKEEKIVIKDGQPYRITVTKNRMRVEKLDAKNPASVSLLYRPEDRSWYAQNQSRTLKIATVVDEDIVQVYNADGSSFVLNTATGLAEGNVPALAAR